jgi:MADS-box transcription factor
MADITDQHDQGSPSALDEHAVGNGNSIAGEGARGIKRQRPSTADDDDDDDDKPGRERRKIEIKFITDKSRRHITFSKRKAGIMKKVSINCFIYAIFASSRQSLFMFQETLTDLLL